MIIVDKIKVRLCNAYKLWVMKDAYTIAITKWFKEKGDKTLRLSYPLNKNSIVFDVGGFYGNWAGDIFDKYDCTIYVFEPVTSFYNKIAARFKNNKKIKLYHFGLSQADGTMELSLEGDASSTLRAKKVDVETVQLKDIEAFCKEHKIEHIDLIKMNIEGGEYDLLERMIEVKLITKCKNIQIQFHDFVPNAEKLRDKIRTELQKTHKLTYDYYFVWENWERIEN